MKKLISISGPTGIGKTQLAIAVAQHFQTEIISCDSRQFFKEMKIGTAAPSPEELREVPHHFIGHLSVTDAYSIGQYELDALQKLEELFAARKVVVMAGGSMMYEKAVTEGLNDLPEASEIHQEKLNNLWKSEGIEGLQQLLQQLDEKYYHQVDLDNPRRLLRAIDVIWQTGRPYSELIALPRKPRDFQVIRIGITAPREVIYERINSRVEVMMESGLLEEARSLLPYQELVPLKTVGYTELFRYFAGEWDLPTAVSEIKKNSRRFAKRQLTWYRGEMNIHRVDFEHSREEALSLLENLI